MLSSITSKMIDRVNTIEVFLRWFEIIDYPYSEGSDESRAIEVLNFPRGTLHQERILRHSAVITILYSIYEEFTLTALSFWLSKLPSYSRFNELSEQLRNKYRFGISKLIRDINHRRFRHIDLNSVLINYLKGLNDESGWSFVKEGLAHKETNLRRNELEDLFIPVGFDKFWKKLEDNKHILYYQELRTCPTTPCTNET